jgi:hypothetical protein
VSRGGREWGGAGPTVVLGGAYVGLVEKTTVGGPPGGLVSLSG